MYLNIFDGKSVNDPRPGIASAFGLCVISTGDVLVFGGIVDSIFSSQFWLLKFSPKPNSDTTQKTGGKNNADKSTQEDNVNTVNLIGSWKDLRSPSLLTDEQIGINEHIALVIANNNQIMMEVNNQENGDEEDDEIPAIDIQFIEPRLSLGTLSLEFPPPRQKGELPPGRWGHTLLYYKHYVFLYGGSRPGVSYGDIWVASEREILGEEECYFYSCCTVLYFASW
jgi:Kelch motif